MVWWVVPHFASKLSELIASAGCRWLGIVLPAMPTERRETPVVVLDTRAAAEFLGVSPRTLEGLRVRGGGVPFVKIGGAVRYRLATLEAYLQQQERNSTSDPGAGKPATAVGAPHQRPHVPNRRRSGRGE